MWAGEPIILIMMWLTLVLDTTPHDRKGLSLRSTVTNPIQSSGLMRNELCAAQSCVLWLFTFLSSESDIESSSTVLFSGFIMSSSDQNPSM